jgi:uncharacterized protein (DUF1499 family)
MSPASPATRLAPCPGSPNCVSSRAAEDDERHHDEPIPMSVSPGRAREILLEVLGARPRTEILTAEATYLHATETSALLRFVDDVELEIDAEAGEIHFRSASRVGYSDLGANFKRMDEIRRAYLHREGQETG